MQLNSTMLMAGIDPGLSAQQARALSIMPLPPGIFKLVYYTNGKYFNWKPEGCVIKFQLNEEVITKVKKYPA